MNRQVEQRQWFDDTIAQNSLHVVGSDSDGLNQMRQLARERLAQLPVPQRKQESWRYTNLSDLYAHRYYRQTVPVTALDEDDIDEWIYSPSESYRLVFANGQFIPTLSNIELLPHGIKIGSLHSALVSDNNQILEWLRRNRLPGLDVFTELNQSLLNDGLFIHVAANVEVTLPIEVVYLNLSFERDVLSQPRSLVIMEDGARMTLLERFTSTGNSSYFFNAVSQLCIGEQAALQHYRLQNESRHAHHLSRVIVQQHSASDYRNVNIATGGAWSRTDLQIGFSGPQASCAIEGVFTVGDAQYTDFHLDVRHGQPDCRSRENFRGIVHGKGQAVFDGRIVVEKDAQKTDALLTNKNLLLCEDAEVDTKPQLEIYADDVKCGHGTTVGKLDPDQIFYLRSRGISEHAALRMLCLGFAEQILSQVKDERLHDIIAKQIASQLTQMEEG